MRPAVAILFAFLLPTPAYADFQTLLSAARTGDLELLKAELAAGTDPNPPEWEDGYSPLQFAAGNGEIEMTRLLLAAGADTEYRDHNRERPLIWATEQGHSATVALLLEAGSPADSAGDPFEQTPLMDAARGAHETIARLLLGAGANPNAREQVGDTPLHFAAYADDAEIVRMLLDAGANPNVFDEISLETPLHQAMDWAGPDTVQALLAGSAVPDVRNKEGQTPLFAAAQRGRGALIELLIQAGVDPDAPDLTGQTPILAAISFAGATEATQQQAVLILAEHTKDLDRAFSTAIAAGYPLAATRLLARGADVNALDADGRSALANAARLVDRGMFDLLLQRGVALDRFGGEALLAAAEFGRADIAATLIGRGIAVDSLDARGATPLLLAAKNAHVEMVEFLLAAGAERLPVDALGWGFAEYMEIVPGFLEWRIDRREASRAYRPTEDLHIDLERMRERQAAIRVLLAGD